MVTTIIQLVDNSVFYLPKMMAIIGIAETNSEHPIASAITKFVREALKTDLIAKCTDFNVSRGILLQKIIVASLITYFVCRLSRDVASDAKCLI